MQEAPGDPGLAHSRTCPTRSEGASQGLNCREFSCPGSWAPEPTPWPGGEGSHLPLPPEAPVSRFRGWVDRTEQYLRPGMKAGPAGRRGTGATTGTTAVRLTSQRDSPADQPRARTPKTSALAYRLRKDHVAAEQSSRWAAMLLLTRPGRLPRQYLSPQPPRLLGLTDAPQKSRGCYGRLRAASRGLARAGVEQPGRCSSGASAASL